MLSKTQTFPVEPYNVMRGRERERRRERDTDSVRVPSGAPNFSNTEEE